MHRPKGGPAVALVTHHDTTGPSDALEAYLRSRSGRVVVLEHGFLGSTARGSTMRVWEGGLLARRRRLPWSSKVPGPLTWFKDFAVSLALPVRVGRVDHWIGIDSLNALAGLVLRRLGLVGKVSFWTIDYADDRFGSKALNALYLWLDRVCVERADETWNVSPRMEPARARRGVAGRQKMVPMGARLAARPEPAEPHRIVYMGSLLPKQGVQMAIEALPLVRAAVPDARLLVIGGGAYLEELRRVAERCGVADAVELTGYLEDHGEVERLIGESGVAVATYDPVEAGYSYYADPGKIKNYLGAGVPVVVTDVPWSARWLAEAGAGVLVEYAPADVARGILRLLDDGEARRHAARLGRGVDWDVIFAAAFGVVEEEPVTRDAYRPTA
jgi:glycosyltransferase involved in cell wall biosynthesis